MGIWYRLGTVAVTNGSTTVTGTATAWTTNARPGDVLLVDGQIVEIATVGSNTAITLAVAWSGSTASGLSYAIVQGVQWGDVTRLSYEITQLITNQSNILSGSGAPSNTLGADGDVYFRQDVPQYYAKAGGAWGTAISLTGPTGGVGPTGPTGATGPANSLSVGTVTTGAAGSSASATLTGTAPAQTLNLTIPRGATGVTGATGATGNDGPQGPAGASYAGTSTTSLAIGTGSKTLTTQSGLAYSVNASRVRVANSTTNWMAGLVTAYSGASMTVAVDEIGGTGTLTSWTLSLAGEKGSPGTDGVSFSHEGDYNAAVTYSYGQNARDGGALWLYINSTPSAGNAPPALPTTSDTYWTLAAKDGVDGSGATNSVNGETGDVILTAMDVDIEALTPTRYAPAGATVEQHLAGIDSALATAGVNSNLLINGDGAINQRAATTAADGAYFFDRWYALTQSAAVGVSQVLDVASGVPHLMRLTQSSASAQRIGAAQVLTAKSSKPFRGQSVAFSGKIRASVAGTYRYAILEWTGTADTVTRDVVLSWTSTTFAANAFFLASGVAVTAVGSIVLASNTLTDISAITGVVSASCNNLMVMVWSDAALTQTATFDFRAKLEAGAVASSWTARHEIDELSLCQYFYRRIAPGVVAGSLGGLGVAASTTLGIAFLTFDRPMRTAATFGFSAVGDWSVQGASGSDNSCTALSSFTPSERHCELRATIGAANLVTGNAARVRTTASGAWIDFNSEL